MRSTRYLAVALLTAGLVAACGSEDATGSADGDTVTTATTAADDTATTADGGTTTTAAGTTEPVTTADDGDIGDDTATTAVTLEQPAIWPAPGVVFDTPEAAAEDFVTEVLDVPANLGEFMQGDARSGEIDVLFPGEDGAAKDLSRGLLLLRQLGPDDGWFVLAAVNPNASITSPEAGATVPAGPITVEGVGRGFEGTVVLTAFQAGDDEQLDQVITQGGPFADPEPFTETLDLSGAEPGTTVLLLVQGGVGLETDPGDFGAIPVVISG